MAKSPTPAEPEKLSRRQQLAQTYQMAKKSDPAIGAWVAGGAFVVAALVGFGLFFLVTGRGGALSLGLSIGSAASCWASWPRSSFLPRRAQKAVYGQIEGQAGAAAGALGMLKRGWRVDPAVAFTKQQDLVHRVVGAPGVVLVGEGNRAGRGRCSTRERRGRSGSPRRPVHEIVAGNDEGQVPLAKLSRHVQKMKRQVQPADIADILARLKAIDAFAAPGTDAQGPGPHLHEGSPRQHARPLRPDAVGAQRSRERVEERRHGSARQRRAG